MTADSPGGADAGAGVGAGPEVKSTAWRSCLPDLAILVAGAGAVVAALDTRTASVAL